MFRTYALKAVADSRGQLLPGDPGQVYDTLALTEDNEMTLSLKSLGAKMVSPMQCRVVTEVMPTWRALWRQRMRWQRGALENIGAYGLTRATLRYWLQQIAIGYGTIALNAYLLLLLITLLAADSFQFVWFWARIGPIFVVERVVTVWAVGWRGRAIALPLLIEIAYDLFQQAIYVKSLFDIATGRAAGWNYVPRESRPPRGRCTNDDPGRNPAARQTSFTRAGSRPSPPSSRSTPSSTPPWPLANLIPRRRA